MVRKTAKESGCTALVEEARGHATDGDAGSDAQNAVVGENEEEENTAKISARSSFSQSLSVRATRRPTYSRGLPCGGVVSGIS